VNESQRSVLSIVLAGVERDLLLAQQTLEHPPRDGLLTRYTDLPPRCSDGSLDVTLEAIRGKIKQLTEDLRLEPHEEPVRRTLVSRLLLDGVALAEVDARGLRGYGAVDPATAKYLQRELPQLRELLDRLVELLGASSHVTRLNTGHPHEPPAQ